MQIVIFGAPGVGKGTQAKILSKKFDIPHISTGEILRAAVKNQTELGKKVKETIEKGELVSDETIGSLVKEVICNPQADKGFILDGFPRTVAQVDILKQILKDCNKGEIHFIVLDAADEIIIERISNRRICTNCQNIINVLEKPVPEKCPVCGAVNTYYHRKDDQPEVVKKRLDVYNQQTKPVLKYIEDKNWTDLIRIDGTMPIDKVTNTMLESVEKVNS